MVRERGKPRNVAGQDLSEKQKDLNDTVDRACMERTGLQARFYQETLRENWLSDYG